MRDRRDTGDERGPEPQAASVGESPQDVTRRSLLKGGVATAVGLSAPALAFGAFLAKPAAARRRRVSPDYGPLFEVADPNSGLPLLKLPKGFEYVSFGVAGDTMADGSATPGSHDGMAVVQERGNKVTLVRNHELNPGTPFGPSGTPTFDPTSGGGTTKLVFDRDRATLVEDWASLTGTLRNCAGGCNPWNRSWLTCEETINDGHGFVFEVPHEATASALPIEAAGRFSHEAVAMDPRSGVLYETEDSGISGFYRYSPKWPRELERGGKLQMLRIRGSDQPVNLNGGNPDRNALADTLGLPRGAPIPVGKSFRVDWVDIPDPLATTGRCVDQGLAEGAAFFTRGEGAWYDNGSIFFVSSDGGAIKKGLIWEYDIYRRRLTLIFESIDVWALNKPDNITVAPSGELLLCEDGNGIRDAEDNLIRGDQLVGLTRDGDLFAFCENNIVIPEDQRLGGWSGDQRHSEWVGASFTFDGEWLFANIQTPGITFAITGPWEKGAFAPRRRHRHLHRHHRHGDLYG